LKDIEIRDREYHSNSGFGKQEISGSHFRVPEIFHTVDQILPGAVIPRTRSCRVFGMDPSVLQLIENGGLIGALCVACWFLSRRNEILIAKVESRYDAELCDMRRRQTDCERDRENLHAKIAAILAGDD
jgi:hypothetical protein